MSTERQIQVAVARTDLILSCALRWVAVIVLLAIVLFTVLLVAWVHRPDPYLIDYDAPGVDITSEGPDDDYTDAWKDWR